MKERYPYLVAWKRSGFDRFPAHLPGPVKDNAKEEAYVSGFIQDLAENLFGEHDSEAEKAIREHFEEHPATSHQEQWEKRIRPLAMQYGLMVLQVQADYQNHRIDRNTAKEKLGDLFLESSQGGTIVIGQGRKGALLKAYDELIECIEEARRKMDLPIRNANKSTENVKLEDIESMIPDIESIFDQNEIKAVISKKTIRNIAEQIMTNRLKKTLPIGYKSIRNLISSIRTANQNK